MKKSILILIFTISYSIIYSQQKGTFKDPRDSKVYKIVKIGTQTWFAENLAYKSNDGCWAYDNNIIYVSKYGYLYAWESAKTVCPVGWHLPDDKEWTTLVNFLGGEEIAGGKMKKMTDWNCPLSGAVNENGFNTLPAGYRFNDGKFTQLGDVAYFWSETPDSGDNAWLRFILCTKSTIYRYANDSIFGLSVRCTKD